jgi:hypothetical protein
MDSKRIKIAFDTPLHCINPGAVVYATRVTIENNHEFPVYFKLIGSKWKGHPAPFSRIYPTYGQIDRNCTQTLNIYVTGLKSHFESARIGWQFSDLFDNLEQRIFAFQIPTIASIDKDATCNIQPEQLFVIKKPQTVLSNHTFVHVSNHAVVWDNVKNFKSDSGGAGAAGGAPRSNELPPPSGAYDDGEFYADLAAEALNGDGEGGAAPAPPPAAGGAPWSIEMPPIKTEADDLGGGAAAAGGAPWSIEMPPPSGAYDIFAPPPLQTEAHYLAGGAAYDLGGGAAVADDAPQLIKLPMDSKRIKIAFDTPLHCINSDAVVYATRVTIQNKHKFPVYFKLIRSRWTMVNGKWEAPPIHHIYPTYGQIDRNCTQTLNIYVTGVKSHVKNVWIGWKFSDDFQNLGELTVPFEIPTTVPIDRDATCDIQPEQLFVVKKPGIKKPRSDSDSDTDTDSEGVLSNHTFVYVSKRGVVWDNVNNFQPPPSGAYDVKKRRPVNTAAVKAAMYIEKHGYPVRVSFLDAQGREHNKAIAYRYADNKFFARVRIRSANHRPELCKILGLKKITYIEMGHYGGECFESIEISEPSLGNPNHILKVVSTVSDRIQGLPNLQHFTCVLSTEDPNPNWYTPPSERKPVDENLFRNFDVSKSHFSCHYNLTNPSQTTKEVSFEIFHRHELTHKIIRDPLKAVENIIIVPTAKPYTSFVTISFNQDRRWYSHEIKIKFEDNYNEKDITITFNDENFVYDVVPMSDYDDTWQPRRLRKRLIPNGEGGAAAAGGGGEFIDEPEDARRDFFGDEGGAAAAGRGGEFIDEPEDAWHDFFGDAEDAWQPPPPQQTRKPRKRLKPNGKGGAAAAAAAGGGGEFIDEPEDARNDFFGDEGGAYGGAAAAGGGSEDEMWQPPRKRYILYSDDDQENEGEGEEGEEEGEGGEEEGEEGETHESAKERLRQRLRQRAANRRASARHVRNFLGHPEARKFYGREHVSSNQGDIRKYKEYAEIQELKRKIRLRNESLMEPLKDQKLETKRRLNRFKLQRSGEYNLEIVQSVMHDLLLPIPWNQLEPQIRRAFSIQTDPETEVAVYLLVKWKKPKYRDESEINHHPGVFYDIIQVHKPLWEGEGNGLWCQLCVTITPQHFNLNKRVFYPAYVKNQSSKDESRFTFFERLVEGSRVASVTLNPIFQPDLKIVCGWTSLIDKGTSENPFIVPVEFHNWLGFKKILSYIVEYSGQTKEHMRLKIIRAYLQYRPFVRQHFPHNNVRNWNRGTYQLVPRQEVDVETAFNATINRDEYYDAHARVWARQNHTIPLSTKETGWSRFFSYWGKRQIDENEPNLPSSDSEDELQSDSESQG